MINKLRLRTKRATDIDSLKSLILQTLAWYGVFMVILAYTLISFSFIDPHSFAYLVLNAVGSFFLILETSSRRDYQPMMLNSMWLIIALLSVLRYFHQF